MAENSTAQALGEMNENLKVLLENYNNAFIKLKEASEAERVELQKEATKAKQALEDLLSSGSVANASKIGGKTLDEIESSIKVALKNYEETFKQLEDANANDRAKFKEELAKATQNLEDLLANATTNVVLVPTIQGATKVTNTNDAVFSFESESLLSGATIKAFETKVNDELYTVTATSNKATFTHKFAGAIGDKITLEVTAVDNLSNKSVAGIYEVEIVDNQAPTKPTVTVTDEMTKGATSTLKINGSTDADGDSITYSIINTGTFTFSKTTGITENESIDITAPNVDEDTNTSFSVVAVDSKGMQSESFTRAILIKAGPAYGNVDIFSDDTCLEFFPLKENGNSLATSRKLIIAKDCTTIGSLSQSNLVNINSQRVDFKDNWFYKPKDTIDESVGAGGGIWLNTILNSNTDMTVTIQHKAIADGSARYASWQSDFSNDNYGSSDNINLVGKELLIVLTVSGGISKARIFDKNGVLKMTQESNIGNGVSAKTFYGIGQRGCPEYSPGYYRNFRIFKRNITNAEIVILANEH